MEHSLRRAPPSQAGTEPKSRRLKGRLFGVRRRFAWLQLPRSQDIFDGALCVAPLQSQCEDIHGDRLKLLVLLLHLARR
jgi:hypothetical protein